MHSDKPKDELDLKKVLDATLEIKKNEKKKWEDMTKKEQKEYHERRKKQAEKELQHMKAHSGEIITFGKDDDE